MKITIYAILFSLVIISPLPLYAHPGRTESSGCHTCKTNCTNWGLSYGEYHCHNSKGLTQPIEPVKSTYGENGTGYTSPAPQYKPTNDLVPATTNTINKYESSYKAETPQKSETISIIKPENKGWFSRFIDWLF